MKKINISPRLLSAADFVRQDAILADIGTDHAYLPLFLLAEGRIRRAVCSDINEGPLATARANVAAAGFSDRVEFTLADGADALMGRGVTDFAICGMGGELIADIIGRSSLFFDGSVRLILQPMTRRGELVKFLYSKGFRIDFESYSVDSGKTYVTLAVSYVGTPAEVSDIVAEIGSCATPCKNKEAKALYLQDRLAAYKKRAEGVAKSKNGGEDFTAYVEYTEKMLNDLN